MRAGGEEAVNDSGDSAIWVPSLASTQASNWSAFLRREGLDYAALAARASTDPLWFWNALIRFLDIRFVRPYETVLDLADGKPWPRWCVGATTNLLLSGLDRHAAGARAAHEAIVWEGEDGAVRRWTYRDLAAETSRLAAALRGLGVRRGDPVALYMPMLPETAAAFLAVAKIGAVALPLFSGFGAAAIATRLTEVGAKAAIVADGCWRRGKRVLMKPIFDAAAADAPPLQAVVVLHRLDEPVAMQAGRDHWWHTLCAGQSADSPTEVMEADAPLMVVYTSGTTGRPKGTVHTHCGFVTKTAQDFQLCFDLHPEDRLLWMTDLGWLVGPAQIVAATTAGATLVMAEGVPDYPQPDRLWRLARDHRVSILGLSPTIARLMKRYGNEPPARYDLDALRHVASTGEPWDEDSWRWVYDRVLRRRGAVMNYSGGTEMGGILATNILFPIRPASFNGPIPGTGADIVDETGASVPVGVVGELVLRDPCIGTTRGLWHDRERYLESYWTRIPGMWVHGDWASRDADGYWYIHGRSDDTIKVAGKRTGPAEIEALLLATHLVVDAAVVAVPDEVKGTAIACAVVPAPGVAADAALAQRLSQAVVDGLGTAFRPVRHVFVSDLPKTRNMKTMRRAIRATLTGQDAGDLSSLLNPEALDELRQSAGG